MRLVVITLLLPLLLSAPDSLAQDDSEFRKARAELRRSLYLGYARPRQPRGPLREINISDIEVREIEAIMAEKFPGAIVNIGGVIADCPCEDGVLCEDQVWVVAHRSSVSRGLTLSKVDGTWTLGPMQSWQLRYDRLRVLINDALASTAADRFERVRDLQEQLNLLNEERPMCTEEQRVEDQQRRMQQL